MFVCFDISGTTNEAYTATLYFSTISSMSELLIRSNLFIVSSNVASHANDGVVR